MPDIAQQSDQTLRAKHFNWLNHFTQELVSYLWNQSFFEIYLYEHSQVRPQHSPRLVSLCHMHIPL